MVYFSLWRAEKAQRTKIFNHKYIYRNDPIALGHTACYLEQESIEVPVPIPDERGNFINKERKMLKRHELWEEMIKIHVDYFDEEMPMFKVWKNFFSGVCPISLIMEFPEADEYVRMESAASEYGKLPYDGGYLDQPAYIMEAFDTVRQARIQYERDRQKKLEKQQKQSNRN